MDNKYGSRKFVVTMYGMTGVFALAALELLTPTVGTAIAVLGGGYSYVQGKLDGANE